ncbi:type II toxin-antitoxin system VapC family toxin [Candidatus Poriferisodalis sp.]|uniref:type II toxin-antitoxin system VapC family toxin n=1 Tax=Candidatus Poriferisodalis sp. TaxID=3101277 RepID=UPI003B524782
MIVVDSSVWIDFFNGIDTRQTNLLDELLGVQPILTGDLILTEVLQGFRSDAHLRSAQSTMDTLFFEPMVGRHTAMASALNHRKLRARGITPRKTIDMLIAAFCMEYGHQLLHADRDFEPMSVHLGLTVL